MDVKGKLVVVTGGASGIGRGLCRRFVDEGAKKVIVADVNEAGGKVHCRRNRWNCRGVRCTQ